MTRLATMTPFPTVRRRRRRPAAPSPRRRQRAVGHTAPRPVTWWLTLGTLTLGLLLPRVLSAQGLRSATATVSLVAVRPPDAAREVRDLLWDAGPAAPGVPVTVHLVEGPRTPRLHVRDREGRLVHLSDDGVPVASPRVHLRVVHAAPASPATEWRLVLRVHHAGGVEERPFQLREGQLPP